MRKTKWFHPYIKPMRIGYYETSVRPSVYSFIDYWDGKVWRDQKDGRSYKGYTLYWRGLTEKSK